MRNPNHIAYIICETATTDEPMKSTIIDQKNNRIIVECILQSLNRKNRNGRWYSTSEMDPELNSSRIQELIKTGNFKGECGHPSSKDIIRQQTVDPGNVQIKILKLWREGDLIKAYVCGTQNQLGEDFNNDILAGELPSYSLRALGVVETSSRGAEVKNIKIICWDRVIYPSHPEAYTIRAVTESGIAIVQNKIYLKKDDPGLIAPITNESVINYIKEQSCNIKAIKESFDIYYDSITLLPNKRSVQLNDKNGNIIIVNLESYIQNEIYDYAKRKF